jgi:hypothetical protein
MEKTMKFGSLFVLLALTFATPTLMPTASAKGMKMEEPSKEARAKMATMHEQMAACLKSDKKFSECHDQMMSSCPMMKDGKCPMMMHHDHEAKKGSPDEHSGHGGH